MTQEKYKVSELLTLLAATEYLYKQGTADHVPQEKRYYHPEGRHIGPQKGRFSIIGVETDPHGNPLGQPVPTLAPGMENESVRTWIEGNSEAQHVLNTLSQHGEPYVVGGGVRDALLGIPSKDIDIEVYGLTIDELSDIVQRDLGGKQDQVGKIYGVFKVGDFDISLPRTETKIGAKHTDFDVEPNPNLPPELAAKRRDFTINALMYDYKNDKVLDFFGGVQDLEAKRIKHVSPETFVEDPLRVYRAAQFASRFDFSIDPSTQELARSMDLSEISNERVFGEFEKLLLKSPTPSTGIQALDDMGVLDTQFPEIAALKDTHQRSDHHAEGDVFVHTKMTLDKAAEIIQRFPDQKDKTIIMLAALCHDLGKPETTTPDGRAIGHERAGVPLTEEFLGKLTNDREILATVPSLVEDHLKPLQYHRDGASDAAFRRLINKHGTEYLNLLSAVSEADASGRLVKNPDGSVTEYGNEENVWFRDRVKQVSEAGGLKEGKIAPLITGDDLKGLGFKEGRELGDILRDVQGQQEEGEIASADEALDYVKNKYQSQQVEEAGIEVDRSKLHKVPATKVQTWVRHPYTGEKNTWAAEVLQLHGKDLDVPEISLYVSPVFGMQGRNAVVIELEDGTRQGFYQRTGTGGRSGPSEDGSWVPFDGIKLDDGWIDKRRFTDEDGNPLLNRYGTKENYGIGKYLDSLDLSKVEVDIPQPDKAGKFSGSDNDVAHARAVNRLLGKPKQSKEVKKSGDLPELMTLLAATEHLFKQGVTPSQEWTSGFVPPEKRFYHMEGTHTGPRGGSFSIIGTEVDEHGASLRQPAPGPHDISELPMPSQQAEEGIVLSGVLAEEPEKDYVYHVTPTSNLDEILQQGLGSTARMRNDFGEREGEDVDAFDEDGNPLDEDDEEDVVEQPSAREQLLYFVTRGPGTPEYQAVVDSLPIERRGRDSKIDLRVKKTSLQTLENTNPALKRGGHIDRDALIPTNIFISADESRSFKISPEDIEYQDPETKQWHPLSQAKPQQAEEIEIDFKEILKLPEITEEQKSNSPLKFHLETVAGLIEMGEQIPRYWSHRPPGTLGPSEEGGIQAYKISGRGGEAEAISEKFKEGSSQKIIWLQSPADPNDPYIVDASKLNLANVGSESSGFQHAGNIPSEAIVRDLGIQPEQAEEEALPPEFKEFLEASKNDIDASVDYFSPGGQDVGGLVDKVLMSINSDRIAAGIDRFDEQGYAEGGEDARGRSPMEAIIGGWVGGDLSTIIGVRALLAQMRNEEINREAVGEVVLANIPLIELWSKKDIDEFIDERIKMGLSAIGALETSKSAIKIVAAEQEYAEKRTRELFGDKITVYRAYHGSEVGKMMEAVESGEDIEINVLPGTSYSMSKDAAHMFAESQTEGDVLVWKQEIDASDILSAWYSNTNFLKGQGGNHVALPYQKEVLVNPKDTSIILKKDDFVSL